MKKIADISRSERRCYQANAIEEHAAARLKQSLQDAHNLWRFADLVDQNKSEFLTKFIVVDLAGAVSEKSKSLD